MQGPGRRLRKAGAENAPCNARIQAQWCLIDSVIAYDGHSELPKTRQATRGARRNARSPMKDG